MDWAATGLNWADIVIAVLLSVSILRGLMRGLIRAVFDIIAFAASIYLGIFFNGQAAKLLLAYVKLPENIGYPAAFLAVFLITYIIITLASSLLHKLIGKGMLGPLNTLGGGFLGAVKGVFIVWLLLQIVILFPLPGDIMTTLKESQGVKILKPALDMTSREIFKRLPKDIPNISDFFSSKEKK